MMTTCRFVALAGWGVLVSGACYVSTSGEVPSRDGDGISADAEAGVGDVAPEDGVEAADRWAPDVDAVERCPPAPNPAVPALRLRSLTIGSPTAMTNVLLRELFNSSMEQGTLIWLMRFDGSGSGSVPLRTGGGQRVPGLACTYRFFPEPLMPAELDLTESGLEFASSHPHVDALYLPMWEEGTAYPEPPLMILPLNELTMDGTFSADHLYVGSYDPTRLIWAEAGTIQARITVAEARATIIDVLGMTLCGLISGDPGVPGDPSDDCGGDPTTWRYPPDATVGTEPAWTITATFAASPVHVVDG